MGSIGRGLVAGAFGTLLLDAVTYADLALTGRPASRVPGETVKRSAEAVGLHPPSDEFRLEAYGALGGIATGLGMGVLVSMIRSAGVRLPARIGAAAIGGLAMAATDGPMAAGGVADPRSWSREDWMRDVVPHLAYGAGVRYAMDRVDGRPHRTTTTVPGRDDKPSGVGVLTRSALLGIAAGGRSSLAIGGPFGVARGGLTGVAAAGLVAAELVIDKMPGVPSRLDPGPLGGRLVGGAVGAGALARLRHAGAVTSVAAGVVGAAGAFAGSIAGATWRELAAERGWTWQAALAEDAVALGLTIAACR